MSDPRDRLKRLGEEIRDFSRATELRYAALIAVGAEFDLRLMSEVNGVSRIPTEGKNLVVVAAVDQVLHFRIFDRDGKMVLDTDEKRLTERVRPIEALRNRLERLWPPHELTGNEKDGVITAVTSIVDHTLGDRYTPLGSDRSWDMPPSYWEAFPKSKRTSPPIEWGSFERRWKWNPEDYHRNGISYCYYGNINDSEWRHFKDWAAQAMQAALGCSGVGNDELASIHFCHHDWMYICFGMAWEHPDLIRYSVESDYHAGPPFPSSWPRVLEAPTHPRIPEGVTIHPSPREFDPFASLEAFDAYERNQRLPEEGRHYALLSRDIRICSASAIEAITSLASPETAKREKPAPIRDKVTEERDKWIYERCYDGLTYKNIMLTLAKNTSGWDRIESPQGIRDRAKAYAKRHGLPEPPPRQS
jgi:hypothetical protein